MLFLVEIDNHCITHRVCLAGQNKALLNLPWFKPVGDIHINLTLKQLCLAGRAHATLAGIRQIHALINAGVEDVLTIDGELELTGAAVHNDRDITGLVAVFQRSSMVLPDDCFRIFCGRGKQLKVYL